MGGFVFGAGDGRDWTELIDLSLHLSLSLYIYIYIYFEASQIFVI
jgi:hypothetical protein